jgi:hypothetical protein
MSVAGIQVGAGISFGAGIGLGSSTPPSGPLTFTYSQIVSHEDQTAGAGGNGTGIVIVNPVVGPGTGPGVAFSTTAGQETTIAGLTPVPGYQSSPGVYVRDPLLYTATWSAGSTYTTTPVQVEYYDNFGGLPNAWIIYVLNPGATAGQAGTFNFPVTFTATPNTVSYVV